MLRIRNLAAVSILAVAFCAPGRAQDSSNSSPSLGDIARQAQKDKAAKSAASAKVLTNDDLTGGSGGISSSLSAGASQPGKPGAAADGGEVKSPEEALAKLQSVLVRLDGMDATALGMDVLGGNTANFPGRKQWEQKMFAAKQAFVSQIRGALSQGDQIAAAARSLKNGNDPNDPQVRALGSRLEQTVQQIKQDTAAFQAVIQEGKTLAAAQ